MENAITFEIPLKRNFFSRTLTTNLTNANDASENTLTYTSTLVDVEEGEDAIYEVAVWDNCNSYGCMITGLDEVDSKGAATYPESQVLAVRICLDANGNEDPLGTISNCRYGRSLNSFMVFSIASRIEGDAMTIDTGNGTADGVRKLSSETPDEPVLNGSQTSWSSPSEFTTDTLKPASGPADMQLEIPGGQSGSSETIGGSGSSSETVHSNDNDPGESSFPAPGAVDPGNIPGGDQTDLSSEETPPEVTISVIPTVQTTFVSSAVTTQAPTPTTVNGGLTTQTPTAATISPQPEPTSPTPSPSTNSDQNKSNSTKTTSFRLSAAPSPKLAAALTRKAYLKNAKKIFTVTVGRLSWKLDDLANKFGATCNSNVSRNRDCQGLAFELTNISKQLVVGRQYLPLGNLREFSKSPYLWTTLAKIKRDSGFGGDFASSKAFKETNWPIILNGTACKSSREEYLMSTLDNHLYSQHSFQPAYTASLMWLFQYGTANAFSANKVRDHVFVSTPDKSAYFTYGACGLIVVLSLMVSVKAYRQNGTRPDLPVLVRTVAEVIMNANQYPPAFLTCYVHSEAQDTSDTEHGSSFLFTLPTAEPKSLQEFEIRGLQLESRHSKHHQWFSDGSTEKA